ncbi:MAG: hypothetical protein DI556_20290 [Rhodovulum sulfidophilum]|uniref:Xylose isomerase-like TIM barrel domain-containing protein n=1 Tax=Rhodovulum sulfidophilum TaxID=35806 RepID=A0A2W5Q4Y3_RHOSU|nr:MAG: hypothetical protein DI556_20290 [Rhodovulum sulfidophilum]
MTRPPLICSSHTISGVMPGDPAIARDDFAARAAACAWAGFDGLCLHMRDYALQTRLGASPAALRSILERNGLAVTSVEFLSDWASPTEAARANTDLAFAAARALGAPVVNAGIDALDTGAPLETLVAPLRALCDRAEEAGVRIALEFVAWGSCGSLAEAMDLVAASGGRCGLLLDLWHLARAGVPDQALDAVPPEAVLGLQISDARRPDPRPPREATLDRLFCGEGELDLAGFLARAARLGWNAPVDVEIISPRVAALPVDLRAAHAYETSLPFVNAAWSAYDPA